MKRTTRTMPSAYTASDDPLSHSSSPRTALELTCMRIRSSLYFLIATFQLVAPVQAQWSTVPADSARQDFRRRLMQALELTPGQQDTLRLLREFLQLDMRALRVQVEDGDILAEEGRLRYREAIGAYRVTRDSVLTPAQLKLMERARSHQREQALHAGQVNPEVSQRLVDALEMDDLQRRRWLSQLARQREQVRQLRAEGEMISTDDYRRLRQEYQISFEAILTPEQRLELERIRMARSREQQELDAAQMELLDMETTVEDAWESLESHLGEDLPEP